MGRARETETRRLLGGAAPEAGVEVDAAAIGVRAEDAEAPKIAGAETAETAEMVETAEAEETAEMVETAETAEMVETAETEWGDDDPEDGGAWTTEEDDREGESRDAAAAQRERHPRQGW